MTSDCPHVANVERISRHEVQVAKKNSQCQVVGCSSHRRKKRPTSWLCLDATCLGMFCGSKAADHAGAHFASSEHPLSLNLSNAKVWCHLCQTQVFPDANRPAWPAGRDAICPPTAPLLTRAPEPPPPRVPTEEPQVLPLFLGREVERRQRISGEAPELDDEERPRGLVGLRNLGNTCYMNAALQALSNSNHFRHFPVLATAATGTGALAPHFAGLLKSLWSGQSGAISPTSLLHGVRMTFPAFRGWGQQDSQEFLRCFLDQLHQDLRQPLLPGDPRRRRMGDSDSETDGEVTTAPTTPLHSTRSLGLPRPPSESSSDGSGSSERWETADSGCSSEPEPVPRLRCTQRSRVLSEADGLLAAPPSPGRERLYSDSPGSGPRRGLKRAAPSRRDGGGKRGLEYRSIVTDVFDGRLLSRVQCLTCNAVSETREAFQDLSLPIPSPEQLAERRKNPEPPQGWTGWGWAGLKGAYDWAWSWVAWPEMSLDDCLQAFFSPDHLRGEDMYACEKCKKLRNGEKTCRLLSLPEVLCIHLKRFRHEVMYSSKIGTKVSFPLDGLDLSPWTDRRCDSEVTRYELCAIISHQGVADGGHYIAYCRNSDTQAWHEFDDAWVTEVSVGRVATSEAYVLFYQKVDAEAVRTRQQVVQMLQQLNSERRRSPSSGSSLVKYHVSREWTERFNSFAEPGPVSNADFLCLHGGVAPSKAALLDELQLELPGPVWKMLVKHFGGGPMVNSLFHCLVCRDEERRLAAKRAAEAGEYRRLSAELARSAQSAGGFRVVAEKWVEEWERFIGGAQPTPPGPIDNAALLSKRADGRLYLRNSNWIKMSRDQWDLLYGVYGGGPEVFFTSQAQPTPEELEAAARVLREAAEAEALAAAEVMSAAPESCLAMDTEKEPESMLMEE